jgi:hypothetical protein
VAQRATEAPRGIASIGVIIGEMHADVRAGMLYHPHDGANTTHFDLDIYRV